MTTKQKLMQLILIPLLVLGISNFASAKIVNVWGDGFADIEIRVNDFYDGLPDHSSAFITGSLDSNDLAGVDLLWVIQPLVALTAAENSTLADFLVAGGRIAYLGEHGNAAPVQNNNITASIAALGGHISIVNIVLDGGFHIASVGNGQILAHTLTEGVDSYSYAAFAPLDISVPAETLMYGLDLTSVMMAFENVGPGSIFLITDQNVWDGTPLAEDNAVMFENLLIGITGAPPPNSFTVGGTVSGLTGSVTLQNNGGDDIIKTTNDGFTFTAQAEGNNYAVTVSSQPTGQTCTVTNGSGTIATANVTDVAVVCVDDVVVPEPPPVPMVPVPAMSEWALILLTMLLGLMVFANRKRLF